MGVSRSQTSLQFMSVEGKTRSTIVDTRSWSRSLRSSAEEGACAKSDQQQGNHENGRGQEPPTCGARNFWDGFSTLLVDASCSLLAMVALGSVSHPCRMIQGSPRYHGRTRGRNLGRVPCAGAGCLCAICGPPNVEVRS